ncbi:hypothetical protein OXX59_000498 [Metschnikowia pulcherrima]
MGNKVSKPARKLTGTISHASDIAKPSTSRIQLPSKELKDRFENSASEPANEKVAKSSDSEVKKNDLSSRPGDSALSKENVPEGKDGMDPQADQNYINFINNLGRQIHSHSEGSNTEQVNVRALKQLLNRKNLYKKGQDEVKAQLESSSGARTMIHPRTLTGILYALNDPRVSRESVMKDYQVDADFMKNLERFKVAENVVIIEEQAKEDEIGPKVGQPVARAATDPSLMNENGSVSESVNQERLKELRSRLE